MPNSSDQKQINIRVPVGLYRTLAAVARRERRSVPQTARLLMESGLRQIAGGRSPEDDTAGTHIAALAMAGTAFDWLADEPDLYDDTSGEPVG